jgi:hypothetical protein
VYGTQIRSCNWIGGVDLNSGQDEGGHDASNSAATVLLSLRKVLRVIRIRIGEQPRVIRVGSLLHLFGTARSC